MKGLPRRQHAHRYILAATLAGLLALLVLPVAIHFQVRRYHDRIENQVDPATYLVSESLSVAHEARSLSMAYRLGIPEHLPSGAPSPPDYYALLVKRWRQLTEDDRLITSADPHSVPLWRTGKQEISGWLQRGGPALIKGQAISAAAIGTDNANYRRGVEKLRMLRDRMELLQQSLRNDIAEADRRQMLLTAPLALVCLLLAGLTWLTLAQLQRSEERLRVSVRETNHRVKNNLQIIGALLDMRMQEAGDLVPRDCLEDVVGQVRAMGAVHDLLSRENIDTAASDSLLQSLADLAARSAGVEVDLEATAVPLTTKQALAVGLITNELLQNAGKHGATRSTLSFRAERGAAVLQVRDNGHGFPDDFDAERDANLGLDLVRNLATHELRGGVEFRNEGGACVKVAFPLNGTV